jgi:hypothetical protein
MNPSVRSVELGHVEQAFALERHRSPAGKTIDMRIVPPAPQPPATAPAPGS